VPEGMPFFIAKQTLNQVQGDKSKLMSFKRAQSEKSKSPLWGEKNFNAK
jgi:hypothetical protein